VLSRGTDTTSLPARHHVLKVRPVVSCVDQKVLSPNSCWARSGGLVAAAAAAAVVVLVLAVAMMLRAAVAPVPQLPAYHAQCRLFIRAVGQRRRRPFLAARGSVALDGKPVLGVSSKPQHQRAQPIRCLHLRWCVRCLFEPGPTGAMLGGASVSWAGRLSVERSCHGITASVSRRPPPWMSVSSSPADSSHVG
jgi:hypothetical protein